ncbi:hypothetical protein G8A07_09755 [Roseateles sp. DAIF2]|uniref:hypothetical protein n=1 Tax=Roseateles sp. DAIF2 TaxID=2714952 RepID=UPI0018A2E80F|nr:hypothetical protein [Roseateles sp. DAIF2]QPF73179.1 hypothetical protein G8A07_09755 [Roseateles sp. DAIF2]
MRPTPVLVTLCAALVVGVIAYDISAFDAQRAAFSSSAWRELRPALAETADPGCVLGPMARDLMDSGELNGKAAGQVIQLLGEPDGREGIALIYGIGQCHGWGWHHSELVLAGSAAGRIADVTVRRSQ